MKPLGDENPLDWPRRRRNTAGPVLATEMIHAPLKTRNVWSRDAQTFEE